VPLTVQWAAPAQAALRELARRDPGQAQRIRQRVIAFADSRQGDIKKLAGPGERWRLRVGAWRAIFVFDPPGTITVLAVVPRRDAYRR